MELKQQLAAIWKSGCIIDVKDNNLAVSGQTKQLTAEQIGFIKTNKEAIIDYLSRASSSLMLAPVVDDQAMSLSSSQQRLWILHKFTDPGRAYNMPTGIRLKTRLDLDKLSQIITTLFEQHPVLRTTFFEVDGEAKARVNAVPANLINIHQWSPVSDDYANDDVLNTLAAKPFDFSASPMLRVDYLCNEQGDDVLLLTMHHIASDGVSMNNLLQALVTHWHAQDSDTAADQHVFNYGEFAAAQQRWLEHPATQTGIEFWHDYLNDCPDFITLPQDFTRPEIQGYDGKTLNFELDQATLEHVKTLANSLNTTPFQIVLGAFQLMLHRLSGQQDVCVGTPFANRVLPELQHSLGFFVNAVAIRSNLDVLSDDLSFADYIKAQQQNMYNIYEWQGIPFEAVLDTLNLSRDFSYSPVYQVMFAYQNMGQSSLALDNQTIQPFDLRNDSAKFDLMLTCVEKADGITAAMEFNTSLYRTATVEGFIEYFQALLPALLQQASQPVRQIKPGVTTLPSVEFSTSSDVLINRVLAKATERPDMIALTDKSAQLTWSELALAVNQKAAQLQQAGIEPGARVGLHVNNSVEQVISLLAIQRCGAAYVPLSPQYPNERLAYMASDAQLALVVSDDLTAAAEAFGSTLPVISHEQVTDNLPAFNPVTIKSSDTAYVIYTSGSTGKPKGVVVSHGSAINHMDWMINEFDFQPDVRVLLKTPVSFDASVWEIFIPLLAGGILIVAHEDSYRDPEQLYQDVLQWHPCLLQLVPSLIDAFLTIHEKQGGQFNLDYLFSGGEPLTAAICQRVQQSLPNVSLVNLYGPSEATIDATFWRVPENYSNQVIKIGQPVSNMHAVVLDEALKPVPTGVAGELYLAGAGIATGYIHNASLTEERFLTLDSANPSLRWYKTGDLVRQDSSGQLEFLGRVDQQVKLRGCRIELEEIEATINQQLSQSENAVCVADVAGEPQLVALVACDSAQEELDSQAIRHHLMDKLPAFMVPVRFIAVDSLPRLPNGKINRNVLPGLVAQQADETATWVAPEGDTETLIARVFMEVLDKAETEAQLPGRFDNFFELGGNSIAIAKVVSRLTKELQIELAFADVFRHATPASLASVIAEKSETTLIPLKAYDKKTSLPAAPQQVRYFATYNVTCTTSTRMTTVIGTWNNLDYFKQAVQAIVDQQELFRTGYTDDNGVLMQHIYPSATVEFHELTLDDDNERNCRIALDKFVRSMAFDLQKPPLVKAVYGRLSDGTIYTTVGVFNGSVDAYSGGLLELAIADMYQQVEQWYAHNDHPFTPETESLQFQDFTQWQLELAESDKLAKAESWWNEAFPSDYQGFYLPDIVTEDDEGFAKGQMLMFLLGEELTERTELKAKQAESSYFTFLLASFAELAADWYQRNDVSIGLLYHGRDNELLEEKIGYFVDLFCIKANVQQDKPFIQLAEEVNDFFFNAVDHRTWQYHHLAQRYGQELTEPRLPVTGLHVNNVIVPGDEKQIPADFEPVVFPLPYKPKFDMNIYVHESNRGIFIRMAYANRVMDEQMARKFADQFIATVDKNCQ